MQALLQREKFKEVLRDILLKILFYTHDKQNTILKICVKANQTDILKEILTWPKQLQLNFEENMMVQNWFSFINDDNKTTLEYAMSNNYYDKKINLLRIFQDNLNQDIKYFTISKNKRPLPTQDDVMPIQKKKCLV